MLTKAVVNGDLGGFISGAVIEDRNKIGEYLITMLNEGRVGPPIPDTETEKVLAHADATGKTVILTSDDEVEMCLHLEQFYPDPALVGASNPSAEFAEH